MKKISLSLLLLLFGIKVSAQQYYPFPTQNAKWNEKQVLGSLSTLQSYIVDGDSLIHGETYHILWLKTSDALHFYGGLREENKKVYYIGRLLGYVPEQEILLYDFSKEVGDTVRHVLRDGSIFSHSIVKSIDSIEVAGQYRKRFKVEPSYMVSGSIDYWVEGIGSVVKGLLDHIMPIPTFTGYNYREFICFSENDTVKYLNPKFNDCNPSNLEAIESTMASKINIYIDRQSRLIKIDNIQPEDGFILQLSDMTGKVIRRKSLKETNSTISIPNKPGYLLITVTDPNGKVIKSRKIINR